MSSWATIFTCSVPGQGRIQGGGGALVAQAPPLLGPKPNCRAFQQLSNKVKFVKIGPIAPEIQPSKITLCKCLVKSTFRYVFFNFLGVAPNPPPPYERGIPPPTHTPLSSVCQFSRSPWCAPPPPPTSVLDPPLRVVQDGL